MKSDAEDPASGADYPLKALTRHVEPKVFWRDLTLPQSNLSTLRDICNEFRNISRFSGDWDYEAGVMNNNITALFAGPSGNHKAMAAEAIATDLGIPLYTVDLSKVVSKYIGETEKNLARVFDAAGGSGALLFFDEGDALFGERTEVRDSHDRYANVAVANLLERIGTYPGIVILATNLNRNLDQTFLRRIRFILDFPVPNNEERRNIWDKVVRKLRRLLGRPR